MSKPPEAEKETINPDDVMRRMLNTPHENNPPAKKKATKKRKAKT